VALKTVEALIARLDALETRFAAMIVGP